MTSVTNNEWLPNKNPYPPACQGAPGVFPTVLGLQHEQHPNAKTEFFTDWGTYARLFEPGAAVKVVEKGSADEVFSQALTYLESDRPEFLVIHIDSVDHAGHTKGWGGPEYRAAVSEADTLLGKLLQALDRLNLRKSTTVLVVSDHGGKGTSHGGDTIDQIEIPWIINGPGIKAENELKSPVLMQYDTAPTIARVLRVKPSPCWRGQSIDAAFVKPR